jgi:hypothetical protein
MIFFFENLVSRNPRVFLFIFFINYPTKLHIHVKGSGFLRENNMAMHPDRTDFHKRRIGIVFFAINCNHNMGRSLMPVMSAFDLSTAFL